MALPEDRPRVVSLGTSETLAFSYLARALGLAQAIERPMTDDLPDGVRMIGAEIAALIAEAMELLREE